MEELFWGCAGIGSAIVMPALALSAIGRALFVVPGGTAGLEQV